MAKIDFDKFVCKVMDILYHESYYQAESSFYNLFNKSLKDQGLQYNPETKEIESIEQPSEHKLVEAVANEPVEQKPKFKVGDRVMLKPELRKPDDDTPLQNTINVIIGIDGMWYKCDHGCSFAIEDQDNFELVEPKRCPCDECSLYCNGAEPTCPDYQEYLKDTEPEHELTHSEVTKGSSQEMTEFEEEFLAIVDSWCHGDGRVYKDCNKQALKDAKLLISIARKQLQPEFDAEIE